MRPPFITVEGIDGAGKSSHMKTLQAALEGLGFTVIHTKEPGGTPLGERLRLELKETEMALATEVLVAFASRSEHLDKVIRPALRAGQAVISDRFTDSTFAYQGAASGYPIAKLEALEQMIHGDLQPDLTLWFDAAAGIAEQRRQIRSDAEGPTPAVDKFDVKDAAWFDRARDGYLARMAKTPERFAHIDAGLTFEAVAAQVEVAVSTFVGQYRAQQARLQHRRRPSHTP
jgi:dTMP kinase